MSMDVTFLTAEQIWGDQQGNGQLEVMKSYGAHTGVSDLAIVQGGVVDRNYNQKTVENQPAGIIWSASSESTGDIIAVHNWSTKAFWSKCKRSGCSARPVLTPSATSSITSAEAQFTHKITGINGEKIQLVEYGEYPQVKALYHESKELEQAFTSGQLQKTGKTYTFDGETREVYDAPFEAKEHAEYQFEGKRYIRVEAQPYDTDTILSDRHAPQPGEACWIKVQPIEWLVDPSGAWVAKQALFSGVQFDGNPNYDGNFANTHMKQYLQNHFAKEMQVNRAIDSPPVVGPRTAAIAKQKSQREQALEDGQGL